jgi:hypothetical protein
VALENPLKIKALPSGKLSHNCGKSPFLMGKSTISTGPFSIAMFVYQRVYENQNPMKKAHWFYINNIPFTLH